jgi:hypothetical protein
MDLDEKYVVFNNTGKNVSFRIFLPITDDPLRLPVYKRRKFLQNNFVDFFLKSGHSIDVVSLTSLTIEEIKANEDLMSNLSKLTLIETSLIVEVDPANLIAVEKEEVEEIIERKTEVLEEEKEAKEEILESEITSALENEPEDIDHSKFLKELAIKEASRAYMEKKREEAKKKEAEKKKKASKKKKKSTKKADKKADK